MTLRYLTWLLLLLVGCAWQPAHDPAPDPWPVAPELPPMPEDPDARWGVGTIVGPYITDPYSYPYTSNEAYQVWLQSEATNTVPQIWYFMQRYPKQFSPTE